MYSQKDKTETKYAIGLKTYTPISVLGSDKFENENTNRTNNQTNQKTTYYSTLLV